MNIQGELKAIGGKLYEVDLLHDWEIFDQSDGNVWFFAISPDNTDTFVCFTSGEQVIYSGLAPETMKRCGSKRGSLPQKLIP